VWQDGGPALAGRIQLGPSAVIFEGAERGRHASRRIAYEHIASLRLGRGPLDRVGGRPALVLVLGDGETIRVATPELGALSELIEALVKKSGGETQRDPALVNDVPVLG
jgi:hypothetical protein